jgi:tetratricopeptide (TPR) repeat protein
MYDNYYLALAGDTPRYPTLEDLQPLIEVVHHACRAGAYDEAEKIRWERLDQRDRYVITHQLGAYETEFAIASEFFPDKDTSQEPQLSDPVDKRYILNEMGFCLMSLGRLREAAPFYRRKNEIALSMDDWHNASNGYRNLAALHISLGELGAAAEAADQALALARRAENDDDKFNSLSWQAWINHLRGNITDASEGFKKAERLKCQIESDKQYMYSLPGIWHADHLRRTGQVDYARRVSEANLAICERNRWPDDTSKCHRVLGDLDAVEGNHTEARNHYDQAVSIARGISVRDVLIEALLGRGRWAAKYIAQTSEVLETSEVSRAFHDLDEALGYAAAGGYRIYEADIRVALAWAHLAAGDTAKARAEARRALGMSREMGYHWGQVDAEEVLGELED